MEKTGNKPKKNGNKPNKVLYIILSILMACALWLYVRTVDNPDTKVAVTNIPVTFLGEEALNENGMMLLQTSTKTVDLKLQGKLSVVTRLRRDNIGIQVDLSHIAGAGEHSLAYDIIWPSDVNTSSVSVLDRTPFYVDVTVGRQVTRPVEVVGIFTGSVAEGFEAGEFTFNPAVVDVSGEEASVADVAYARVEVKRDELSETIREDMSYTLIGQNGEPIAEGSVVCTPATVAVTYPVTMVKEVPLVVDFIPGGGATGEMVADHVTITPASIVLAGSESDLAGYNAINLGAIDLAKVIEKGSFTFTIPIGQDVENRSGIHEAKVEVTVPGLKTVMMETDNIEVVAPEGVEPTLITQALQVQVRGSEEALDLILPQYIRVVVDLTDQSLPAGQSVVTAKVSLDGVTGAGVIGEYRVSISLPSRIG